MSETGARAAEGGPDGAAPCPMCQSTHRIVDASRSETHCAECGLVFDGAEILVTPPSLQTTQSSEGSGRGIGPFVRPGRTKRWLGSTLSLTRDGQGRRLAWRRRYEFQHLRRVMNRQTARTTDGPLDRSPAHGQLVLVGDKLGLPDVLVAEAERVFVAAKDRGVFRGRSLPSCVGAAVYAACRRFMIPRTLGEVATASGGRRSEVGRTFKMISRAGGISVPGIGTKAFSDGTPRRSRSLPRSALRSRRCSIPRATTPSSPA